MAGRRLAVHVRRRRRDDGPPRRGRQRRPAGRDRRRRRRRQRPQRGRVHLESAERQLPVPRVGVQRPERDHAGRLRDRAPRSTRSPNGTGPWKLTSFDAATGRDVRAQPGLVGRPDAARRPRGAVLRRPRDDGHGDPGRRRRRHRAVLGDRRRRPAQQPRLHGARDRGHDPPPDLDGRAPTASSSRRRPARRWRYTFDREQMVNTLFQGRGVVANDHVIAPFMPFFDDSVPQRTKDIDAAKAAARRGRSPTGSEPCSTPSTCRRSPSSPS